MDLGRVWRPALAVGGLIFIWALATTSTSFFPSPIRVVTTFLDLAQNHNLAQATAASLKRVLEGFAISLIIAIPLGIAMGRSRGLDQTMGPLVGALQSLPSICWMPISLMWFGLNDSAILFVVVMGSAVSMIIAIRDGVKNLPPGYVRAARTLGAKGFALVTDALFPATQATIVIAAKLGWAYAWRALMSGELLFATVGLGHDLTLGRELGDMSQVVAVMLAIMLLGVATDNFLFAPLEATVRERWGYDASS